MRRTDFQGCLWEQLEPFGINLPFPALSEGIILEEDALTQQSGCMLHPCRNELGVVVQLHPESQGSLPSLFQIKY